jgi:hypothetical protein
MLKFSREPIIWLAAVVIALQVVIDWLPDHSVDDGSLWQKLLIAVGAVVGRQLVSPTSKQAPAE